MMLFKGAKNELIQRAQVSAAMVAIDPSYAKVVGANLW
jgi:hypothetical protein